MELDMYGDPKKPCCVCKKGADLNEKGKRYCADHYALYILGKSMSQIEKELKKET
tara:strand:- start:255 stop:419 length:165 start_codon:yes stop_codon:yes gene_type:complete